LAAAWFSGASLYPPSTHADRFVAPDTVVASANGSFAYVGKFFKENGPAEVADVGFGGSNIDRLIHGDFFCSILSAGDSLTLPVSARLLNPTLPGRGRLWVNFCDFTSQACTTVVLPAATTEVLDPSLERQLRLWNEPNPFSAQTTFRYELPAPGRAILEVFDLSGRSMARIVDEVQAAGRHSATWDVRGVPALERTRGVFFGRLTFRGRVQSRAIVVMR
jgi:hypothetical protein